MLVSENSLKWIVRLYPPLFFQRIWVVKFENGFRGVQIKITRGFFNKNYNKSIFGGTIFSAADPFYPILFHQILKRKGYNVLVWSRSSQIHYLKPGLTDLHFNISISDEEVAEVENILNTEGQYIRSHPIDIYNKTGDVVCATVVNEIYLRNLNFTNYAVKNE
jgi:hypothetical protein